MANNEKYGNTLPPTLDDQTECITTNAKELIQILVGNEAKPGGLRKFFVSRPHMEQISDRWRETIRSNTVSVFPGVRRTKPILFPDDDPNTIRLVLHIAHLQFHKLPKWLSLDELLSLAKVAERYDLNHILTSRLDAWLEPHRPRFLEPGYERWLCIAWQFGLEDDFIRLATHLAVHCWVNTNGALLVPTKRELVFNELPFQVMATIQRARLNRLATLFNITHDMILEMSGMNACKQPGLPHVHQYKCTAQNHLGIHRYLRLHGLNPLLTSVGPVRFSAHRLLEILTDPLISRCMWRADAPTLSDIQTTSQNPLPLEIEVHNRHATCLLEIELKRRVTEAMKTQPFAVQASTINDIRWNAGKMDIYRHDKYPADRLTKLD